MRVGYEPNIPDEVPKGSCPGFPAPGGAADDVMIGADRFCQLQERICAPVPADRKIFEVKI
jgi:hypothetical protein